MFRPIFGLGSRDALGARLRIVEHVGIAGPDDAPAACPAAEQIALSHLDPGDPSTQVSTPAHSNTFSASATVLRAQSSASSPVSVVSSACELGIRE